MEAKNPYVKPGLEHEVVVPPADDYHGHPNYQYVIIVLIALLAISLLSDFVTSIILLGLLVFGTALVKSILVIRNFMHWKYEPLFIWIITFFAVLFILLALFWGMYPDFDLVKVELAPK